MDYTFDFFNYAGIHRYTRRKVVKIPEIFLLGFDFIIKSYSITFKASKALFFIV